jgi:uncharacterized membrane protein YphA (DoxX/SURF4 family)
MVKMPSDVAGSRWGLVLLRLVIGCGFMVHGWAKFSRGPAGFARLLAQIGHSADRDDAGGALHGRAR